ncbi:MAG: hypothetical protein JW900_05715 [Anaerolineae bacterium]|nr:hypothetical protein [Anaerolineae bacterium]
MTGAEPAVAALIDESLAFEQLGDIAAALDVAQKALKQAQASGEGEETAAALAQLAFLQFRLGHYDQAHKLAEQALTWAAPDSPARCRAWLILGHCAAESHSPEKAETYYRQTADLARRIGSYAHWARALHNLANGVYFTRGLFDLALSLEDECAQIIRRHNLGVLLRFPLLTIAWVCHLTGQRERARAALDELAHVLSPEAAFWGYHAFLSALLALDEGEVDAARALLRRALTVAEKIGEPGLNGIVRVAMSRCLRLCGDAPAARAWANDVMDVARRFGYQHLLGQALIERGWATWLCGDADGAAADLRQAQAAMAPLRADFDMARATFLLAAVLHAQGDPAASTVWLEAVQRITLGGYAFLLEQERALAFPLLSAYLNQGDEATQGASAKLLIHLARVPPPPLRVVTLGCFEVRQGLRVVPEAAWRLRRAGELFRLLLFSRNRALSREQAIETLWPEKSPRAANTPFHQATSALRRALEPDLPDKFPSRYLEVEGGRVALHLPPGSWLDWETFEQHVHRGEWQAAVALYAGELCPDDRYADWATVPRERLAQQFVAALLALAGNQLDAGDPQEALVSARRVLEADPWQEKAVLLGMQAYLALGDRAGALRLYRNLERVLHQELGVAPQAELQKLYQSLV